MYNPHDWYWIVGGDGWHRPTATAPLTGDDTQVYSSARLVYVPVADVTYLAWIESAGPLVDLHNPTNRIDTEANLAAVLAQYGITAVFE